MGCRVDVIRFCENAKQNRLGAWSVGRISGRGSGVGEGRLDVS